MTSKQAIKGLSLFSNVGIAETYLKDIGFEIAVANELLPNRAEFYLHSHPHCKMICGDITKKEIFSEVIEQAKKEKVEFILATPPCQGMSKAGKMDDSDPRNILITKVVKAAKELKPKFILIENVTQMLNTFISIRKNPIQIVEYLKENFEQDYNISFNLLDAADYGTPQNRKRAIIILTKKPFIFKVPEIQKRITVRQAIGDLPSLESGQKSKINRHAAKIHNENHIQWLKNTPTGKTAMDNLIHYPKKENGQRIKGFKTTYKRMKWDTPAATITMANGSISSQNNVHPGKLLKDGTYSDARVLSILELLRLTGLPDDWSIPEWATDTLVRHVIGEAVPPRLIYSLFSQIDKKLFK